MHELPLTGFDVQLAVHTMRIYHPSILLMTMAAVTCRGVVSRAPWLLRVALLYSASDAAAESW